MLKVVELKKEYKDKVALGGISLTLPDKGLVIIKGESGSGKTTLLNMLTALDYPTSGKVLFDGVEITKQNSENFRRKYCGNIYQDYMLIGGLTVGENIELGLQASGEEYSVEDIKELIKKVGITEAYIDKKVSNLSGGEKQRVSIARAIAKRHAMIFADEPTGNLDRKNGGKIMDILKEISKDRLVVVVSHNEKFNNIYADYLIELVDGLIKSCDLPAQEEVEDNAEERGGVDFEIKSKMPPKTVVRLATWGFEKNKGKTVVSIISFIIICILSIVFTSATIGDAHLAYAYSLNRCKNKNMMVFREAGLSGGGVERYEIKAFKEELGVDCVAVYSFAIKNVKDDEVVSEEYQTKYGAIPNVSLGMAYDPTVGVDVDVLYGNFPNEPNDAMLPRSYAEYLSKAGLDYKCDDLKELIGREFVAYDRNFSICGIFDEGPFYTDYENTHQDVSEYYVNVNQMAQCVILAPDMQKFLLDLSQEEYYPLKNSFKGYYFNLKDYSNVYGLLFKIERVGRQLCFWDYMPMEIHTENIYFSADIYDVFYSLKYIALLPLTLLLFICMVAMGYVSFSYMVSAKAKSYNVLRTLGFGKKDISLLLFTQVFTVIAIQCILGIALGALGCFIFGKVYASIWAISEVTRLLTEVIMPMGYVAPLIIITLSLSLGGAIVHAKTKSLFAKSIIENKTN